MPQQDVLDAIKKAQDTMAPPKPTKPNEVTVSKSSQGRDAFKDIEENIKLTPQEKQEVYRHLAKEYTTNAMNQKNGGETLMRGNDAGSGLISAYMDKYAEDFTNAMRHTAIQETAKTKIPQELYNKNVELNPGVGNINIDGKRLEDGPLKQKINDASTDLARRINDASMKNLALLTPDVREFMKSVLEPTANNPTARSQAAANILFLRSVNTGIGEDAKKIMAGGTGIAPEGAILNAANIVNQSYYNAVSDPPGNIKRGKEQDIMASKLRDKATLDLSKEGYDALAKGGKDLDNYLKKVGPPDQYNTIKKNEQAKLNKMGASLSKGNESMTQKAMKGQIKIAESGITTELDRVGKLQSRLDRINSGKPSLGDKAHAFFAGGMNKYKTQTNNDLQTSIKSIGTYANDPNNKFDINNLIRKYENRGKTLDQISDNLLKGANAYLQADKTARKGMGQEKFEAEALEKNLAKIDKLNTRADNLKKVRDVLGIPKQQQKVDDLNLNMANTLNNKASKGVNIDTNSTEPKVNAPILQSTVGSDVGIKQLAGKEINQFDVPKPKMGPMPKPKIDPEKGINDLAKGSHLKEEDPQKKINRTVGKELAGKLGQRVNGPQRKLSVGGVG